MSMPFKHYWIAITRPAHQASALTKRLEEKGANIIPFPLLEITEPASLLLIQQQLREIKQFDMAIFISQNAVEKALTFLDKTQLAPLNIAAVGKKTAASLQQNGLAVDYFPDEIFNSEALLALDKMQQVQGQNIIIFRGEGGRDVLRDTLQQRGANVSYSNVYSRRCPATTLEVLKQHHLHHKLDIIILTSGESLQHLLRLARGEAWLNQVVLLVGSQRIKKKFQSQFAGKIWVASDPSDETIYNYLDSYL
ncbi:MAG: uroporphyrinogen-III synthase [Cocleimonas sp.]|nr:uroporphyrinogen-III synthase [Cocleimonas sp.]